MDNDKEYTEYLFQAEFSKYLDFLQTKLNEGTIKEDRYQTICTALMEMSAPRMPVKPLMKTVKCRISRCLVTDGSGSFIYFGAFLSKYKPKRPKKSVGAITANKGDVPPFKENILAN
jgi:hypothetical protein